MKSYILFSKEGRFIGFTSFKPPSGLYKEIEREFNPFEETYIGTFENGEIKKINELSKTEIKETNIDKKWVIYESVANNEIKKHIEEALDLPLYKQVNEISKALYDNKDVLKLSDSFINMFEQIDRARFRHSVTIKSYESFHEEGRANFIKKGDEKAYINNYTKQVLDIEH
jgi:hypothetical protein